MTDWDAIHEASMLEAEMVLIEHETKPGRDPLFATDREHKLWALGVECGWMGTVRTLADSGLMDGSGL